MKKMTKECLRSASTNFVGFQSQEVFRRLPLPYMEKEFSIDLAMVDNLEPPLYFQYAVPARSIKVRFLIMNV